jgi:hypothetical protein
MVDRGGSEVCNDPTVLWVTGGIKTSPLSPPTVIFFSSTSRLAKNRSSLSQLHSSQAPKLKSQ